MSDLVLLRHAQYIPFEHPISGLDMGVRNVFCNINNTSWFFASSSTPNPSRDACMCIKVIYSLSICPTLVFFFLNGGV